MTLIHHQTITPESGRHWSESQSMALAVHSLQDRLNMALAWHRQRRAMAEIEAMPADMRKDIGWPAADSVKRAGNKSWLRLSR